MLMDEPFGAVDPIVRMHLQSEFLGILRGLRKTVIFVTHDIDEAIRMGDLIAIMRDGRLVQCDPPERLLAAPKDQFIADFVGADRALKRLALVTAGEAADPAPPAADVPMVPSTMSLHDVLAVCSRAMPKWPPSRTRTDRCVEPCRCLRSATGRQRRPECALAKSAATCRVWCAELSERNHVTIFARALPVILILVSAIPAYAAADYPARPIRIIVGFAAGGAPDTLARVVGDKLAQDWGQPIVVENRTGAQGDIAMTAVARAAADGYTLALVPVGNAAVNPSLIPNLPYDPVKDFAPITQTCNGRECPGHQRTITDPYA